MRTFSVLKGSTALLALLLASLSVAEKSSDTKLYFFLQDSKDGLCLAGEKYKRCSIDTLFYVVGSPGSYEIHKRPADGVEDDEDDGLCLAKKSCKEGDADKFENLKVTKCSHCGAKNWNILGEAETGYVVTNSDNTACIFRKDDNAMTGPCENEEVEYSPFQLRFASQEDIESMSSPAARFLGAATDGDKKLLQSMLKDKEVEINVKSWDGMNALTPAASAGLLDICKYLIEEGIDVNQADKDGITALMEASIMGHSEVVELLLEKGAEVEATTASEVTALWLAASEGKVDTMKILLEKGASASVTRVDGITALMTAALNGHVDAVKLLLEKGADATATDKDGVTALMSASEFGSAEIIDLILAAVENDTDYVNMASLTKFNALVIASAHGHVDAVRRLLQAGAEVDRTADETEVTPLMYAASSDRHEVISVLIDEGKANIEAKHNNGGNALLEACTTGSVDAIKVLLEKGAAVDIMDDDGVTPLMSVASSGSIEGQEIVLDALKAKMSDQELKDHINLFSKSGGSTIMFAAVGGHLECTKQLLELGADADAIARATPDYLEKLAESIENGTVQQDDDHVDGVTALHVAAQRGHLDVVNFLLDTANVNVSVKDDESRTALTLAIKGNYAEVASALVTAGADPNTPYTDEDGKEHNLLFDAIMVENEDFAKLLIEKGADLYHQDEKKVSTLLQASHRGLSDVVKALLDKHAANGKSGYVDDASDEGITPLIAAASEGHVDVVKYLIEAKADVNAKDQDQTTALMAASARGFLEVVKELLEAKASINEQNADGHSALMFAYNGKNQVETLWERYSEYMKDGGEDAESADDNGTGAIIREALDNHLALIDLLMKNGADATLKDKEGHTAKDFDYHPDADADILDKAAKAEKVRDQSKYEL